MASEMLSTNLNGDTLETDLASSPAPFDTIEPTLPNLSDDKNDQNENREQFSNYEYQKPVSSLREFADDLINNNEFLLNPERMTAQGKLVFYGHLAVAVLSLIAALFDKKLTVASLIVFINMLIMAFLQSNVVNCMVVGQCGIYSTVLSLVTVFGQLVVVLGLLFYLFGIKK
jgi:hypothetical protein